jgi:hypothetical protein
MSATSLYKLEKLYFFLAFFREPLATHRNESSRREQRPSVVYYFFLAFAVFLAGAFLAAGFFAEALQNFT